MEGSDTAEEARAPGAGLRAKVFRDPTLVVSVLACVGYFLIARPVVNFFPFSIFPVYDARHQPSGSRIVARDAAGGVSEVAAFRAWACDRPMQHTLETENRADVYFEPHRDEEAITLVATPSAEAAQGEPIEVVRRIWRFDATGASRTEDRVLGVCRAVRR